MTRLERVARLHYRDGKDQSAIAKKEGVHPSTVNKWLSVALETGVVSIDVDRSFGYVGRIDETLSQRLRDGFELDDALAIEVDGHGLKDLAADDYLHVVLGNQAGKQLGGQILRRDHLAVAGGRAVVQAVRSIRRHPPLRRDVRVSPLSGRIWAHSADFSGPAILRPLDPDDAAFTLALAFELQPGTKLSQVALPLYADDEKQAREWMSAHCPFKPSGTWFPSTPRLAIVGVGAISPTSGHRQADVYRSEDTLTEIEPYIEKAATEIKRLTDMVHKSGLPYLGDVANRLFPALPLPSTDVITKAPQYDQLIPLLNELNRRTIVAGWEHVRSISRVRAIAGGVEKRSQLWTLLVVGLLTPEHRVITELTTDAETANDLLSALDLLQHDAYREVSGLYRKMAGRLFGPMS